MNAELKVRRVSTRKRSSVTRTQLTPAKKRRGGGDLANRRLMADVKALEVKYTKFEMTGKSKNQADAPHIPLNQVSPGSLIQVEFKCTPVEHPY